MFPVVNEASAFLAILAALPISIQGLLGLSVLFTVLAIVARFIKGR